jgi:hypothetical protein
VGCLFKHCGFDGGVGLQFGKFSIRRNTGKISNGISSAGSGSVSVKSVGTLLHRCVIHSCGEPSKEDIEDGGKIVCVVGVGASVQIVAGSSAELRKCTIMHSCGNSLRVLQGSNVIMKMCCVFASSATAAVFNDRSTGQLNNCQIAAASENGVELSGDCIRSRHFTPSL